MVTDTKYNATTKLKHLFCVVSVVRQIIGALSSKPFLRKTNKIQWMLKESPGWEFVPVSRAVDVCSRKITEQLLFLY